MQHSQGEELPREGKAFRHVALGDAVNAFLPSTAGQLQAAPIPFRRAGQGTHSAAALVGGFLEEVAGPAHANQRSLSGSPTKGLAFAGLKLPF